MGNTGRKKKEKKSMSLRLVEISSQQVGEKKKSNSAWSLWTEIERIIRNEGAVFLFCVYLICRSILHLLQYYSLEKD